MNSQNIQYKSSVGFRLGRELSSPDSFASCLSSHILFTSQNWREIFSLVVEQPDLGTFVNSPLSTPVNQVTLEWDTLVYPVLRILMLLE